MCASRFVSRFQMRSRPLRSLRTSPAFESALRCFVTAWREIFEPFVSRTIERGPSSHSRATMNKRVSSPSAANIGAVSARSATAARDRDVMDGLLAHVAVAVRYFSMSRIWAAHPSSFASNAFARRASGMRSKPDSVIVNSVPALTSASSNVTSVMGSFE